MLALLRDGTPAEQIALVVPSVERWRAPLETVFATLGIPYAIDGRGCACRRRRSATRCSRCSASPGPAAGARELYAFLRSPYSGIARSSVDFAEGRLRGRAVSAPDRVEAETERLREAPLVPLRELRAAESPVDGVRALLGVDGPLRVRPRRRRPSASTSRLDLRCVAAATRLLDELDGWEALGEPLGDRRR